MVTAVELSKPSTVSSDGEEYVVEEEATSSEEDDDENNEKAQNAVVLHGDDNNPELPTFGNVSVMNCNDIHFGNKTIYQGPVTIKQVVCHTNKAENGHLEKLKNGDVLIDGVDGTAEGFKNLAFVPDSLEEKNRDNKVVDTQIVAPKGFQLFLKYSRDNIVFLVSLLSLLLVSLTILMVILLIKHGPNLKDGTSNPLYIQDSNERDKNTPVEPPIDPTVNFTLPDQMKFVTRLEWLAQPPVHPSNPQVLPVPYVIIHHTATEPCTSQARCRFLVRYMQTFHIESRNWWDIAYNFMIGGDGEVYEGRGWNAEGSHSKGYNAKSVGIAFIGTFNTELPSDIQIKAFRLLIQEGVEKKFLASDYKLLAARQLQTTEDPGKAFYELIKTWEHWAKAP